jgi:hypothetical protein
MIKKRMSNLVVSTIIDVCHLQVHVSYLLMCLNMLPYSLVWWTPRSVPMEFVLALLSQLEHLILICWRAETETFHTLHFQLRWIRIQCNQSIGICALSDILSETADTDFKCSLSSQPLPLGRLVRGPVCCAARGQAFTAGSTQAVAVAAPRLPSGRSNV